MTIHSGVYALPIVDLSKAASADANTRAAFFADLRKTLHDHGFFYLTGHGVDPKLIEGVLSTSKRFFKRQPEESL